LKYYGDFGTLVREDDKEKKTSFFKMDFARVLIVLRGFPPSSEQLNFVCLFAFSRINKEVLEDQGFHGFYSVQFFLK